MFQLCLITTIVVQVLLTATPTHSADEWYAGGNFYQIYPRSFKDSDNNGKGDLKGVTQKLRYLKDIGVTAIWLSPIFASPQVDFGYDISDFRAINPEYGTMADFDDLVAKCKLMGIRLILDFVPNHSSDQHEWFVKSVNRDPGYEDYYVWKDPSGEVDGVPQPPNNWVSVFRFSAWQYNEDRGQFYLHQFVKEQPDLNYRTPALVAEMKEVLRFWLNKGVAGFRIDAVPFLFEDVNFPNEVESGESSNPDDFNYLIHDYTQNQDETFDMVLQWRAVLDEFQDEPRFMMVEAYTSLTNLMRLYGTETNPGAHVPFNFELFNHLKTDSTAVEFKKVIDDYMAALPAIATPNWVWGNHDQHRLASRMGVNRADLFNIMLNTLKGYAVAYNGEEIAMRDVHLTWAETVDPSGCNTNETVYDTYSRDPARTPIQWDATVNSGFNTGFKPWLRVGDDYRTNNVKAQVQAPFSHLKIFKTLHEARKHPTLRDGTLTTYNIGDDILLYTRELTGYETFVVVLNLGTTRQTIDLTALISTITANLEVITSSLQSPYVDGDVVAPNSVIAYPEVGTVFATII